MMGETCISVYKLKRFYITTIPLDGNDVNGTQFYKLNFTDTLNKIAVTSSIFTTYIQDDFYITYSLPLIPSISLQACTFLNSNLYCIKKNFIKVKKFT